MFCVIQTDSFVSAAKRLGLSDSEVQNIINTISRDPHVGDVIKGTGGARKWRVPARGKGKSGGYRVISFFAAEDVPVFLLDIFSKGEQINLSQAERNELKSVLGGMANDYRENASRKVARIAETG